MLQTRDPVEAVALAALTQNAAKARVRLHEHQAAEIVRRIGELF